MRVPAEAAPRWSALRAELGIVEPFPPEVLAEADDAAASVRLPDLDRRDIPLVTVDPPGSTDLDQALAVEPHAEGFRIHYAIADVTAFVRPGGAVDAESRRRGQTYYSPDTRVPMLPPVLSEGAASLLPGHDRPAVLWTLEIDGAGRLVSTAVERAAVRSRRQLDYEQAMALDELRAAGQVLQADAERRGAVSLPLPEQVVELDARRPTLTFRAPIESERWNEQVSLLTGRAAAILMLEGKVGLLRTLPEPDPADVAALRRSALALGLQWPDGTSYAEFVTALDPHDGPSAAVLTLAPRLLRGAGYTAFDGAPPEQPLHSAVAAPYAHCTAPIRRLADRFVSEVCLALHAGVEIPAWARAARPELPAIMMATGRTARELDRAGDDLAEALVLGPCVGQTFTVIVVDADAAGGAVQLHDPAVRAPITGAGLTPGSTIEARLESADPTTRKVHFVPV